ncbi:MAG: T9SS type A sorting domain-containing protein [Crocinitomicaceae bacterium]|nr:T9SS type A sorting domain-containing protein [Flavobacteriales bacterium]NQZ36744.1 T9SS type A sorting domain-containing protein [Crocinitomicaceae bacterium]
MKKLYTLLGMLGLIAFSTTSIAQCANDNVQFGTSTAPTNVGQLVTLTTCIYGGEYRLVNNMQAGAVYRLETCGDTDFDTQISVYNAGTGALVGYNDDACGLQSIVTFTSDGSSIRASIDRYFCGNQNSCMTLRITLVSGPNASNPCDDITALSGCGASVNFSLAGSGSFNNNGPWNTPGAEQIYSFTAPFSGGYEIEINHSGGFYIDLFYRTTASGCSGSGWTYVDDILSSATNTVNLVGGTTYYFMIDDENTSGSTGSIVINCPCIPSATPDGMYTYNGPFTISGSTNGECNDCSLRPSDDQIHEIEILCDGTYTFETCGGANWDTYLYLTSTFCGNVIASNDDSPCGGGFSLQSSITTQLAPGTYYVTVEAYSSFSGGDYDLSVSGVLTPIDVLVTPQNHIIDCVPIPVDLFANSTGGSGGPYTYLWSTGETTSSISVNPNVTTTYSVTVADGCTETTSSTTVTVINRCGNNNQKSLICHVPSGNGGNPQTICISPNALNAHLATLWDLHGGDYCGPCASNSSIITTDNENLGDNSFIRARMNTNDESIEISYRLAYDSDVRVEIYDMTGALVEVIHQGNAEEGQLYDIVVNPSKFTTGVYIYQFITNVERHIDKLQFIH